MASTAENVERLFDRPPLETRYILDAGGDALGWVIAGP
jgi:hypothetical protein